MDDVGEEAQMCMIVHMDKIKLELSREEFRQLLLLAGIGDFVRGDVLDSRDGDPGDEGELFDTLMRVAFDHHLPEARRHENHIDPSREFDDLQMEFISEYNDEQFWNELERRLGRRDFERSMTTEDRAYIEREGWMPERIYAFYKKYSDEFEAVGIDRLEINKDALVSDIRDALV
jgi:hypothetical protein